VLKTQICITRPAQL